MSDIKDRLIRLGNSNPKLRKHIRPVLSVLGQWTAEGFFRRHPQLKRYAPDLRNVKEKAQGSSSSHGEARQHGNEIWLFPKFFELSKYGVDTQDFVFAHEIGHYHQPSSSKLLKMSESLGMDLWDTLNLPYSQFNFEEAYADCFAAYFLNHSELKSRYPDWMQLIKNTL